MPREARAWKEAAPLFAALGDETRLAIVARLCGAGPQSATKLADGADVTRQAIAKHLRVLEDAGLVRGARDGRENVYELAPRRLEHARRQLEIIERQWDARIDRLRALVESDE